MQDMGNVGSITIDALNKILRTRLFRQVFPPSPNYVIDNGGYIDFQQEAGNTDMPKTSLHSVEE